MKKDAILLRVVANSINFSHLLSLFVDFALENSIRVLYNDIGAYMF